MGKFHKGDKVVVVDKGEQYSTYSELAEILRATNFCYGRSIEYELHNIFTIINSGSHLCDNTEVCLIESSRGFQYLVDEKGLLWIGSGY